MVTPNSVFSYLLFFFLRFSLALHFHNTGRRYKLSSAKRERYEIYFTVDKRRQPRIKFETHL